MRYTNSLHYIDGALKGQQWPRLAPIFILILILYSVLFCKIITGPVIVKYGYYAPVEEIIFKTKYGAMLLHSFTFDFGLWYRKLWRKN